MGICGYRLTVKLYDASNLPMFLVVIVAVPNCVSASNVGMVTLNIFPGLLKRRKDIDIAIIGLSDLFILRSMKPIRIETNNNKTYSVIYVVK